MDLEKKKDPGIPNMYPFKEQLLKQIEERKEKVFTHPYLFKLYSTINIKKKITQIFSQFLTFFHFKIYKCH